MATIRNITGGVRKVTKKVSCCDREICEESSSSDVDGITFKELQEVKIEKEFIGNETRSVNFLENQKLSEGIYGRKDVEEGMLDIGRIIKNVTQVRLGGEEERGGRDKEGRIEQGKEVENYRKGNKKENDSTEVKLTGCYKEKTKFGVQGRQEIVRDVMKIDNNLTKPKTGVRITPGHVTVTNQNITYNDDTVVSDSVTLLCGDNTWVVPCHLTLW